MACLLLALLLNDGGHQCAPGAGCRPRGVVPLPVHHNEETTMAETSTDWTERAESRGRDFAGQVGTRAEEARSEVQRFEQQFRSFVKQRPLVALGGAIFVGYLFGRV